jgi:DNA-binding FadR family transcriptional regulator
MLQTAFSHSILQYIVDQESTSGDAPTKLPPLGALAKKLGVSRGKLREELIAAQAYGVVEMRPGDGTYIQPFDFYTAIRPLVLYSVACDRGIFDHYYRLRARLEVAFWDDAAHSLGCEDHRELGRILERAERKLRGSPIEIPHAEHRDLHELICSNLDNQFVQGLLRAYWDAYEAVGLHRYFEYSYYERMWSSHRGMVEAIVAGEYEEGKEILVRHFTLLEDRLQEGNSS